MPLGNDDVETAVLQHEREYVRHAKLAEVAYDRCLRITEETGVRSAIGSHQRQ